MSSKSVLRTGLIVLLFCLGLMALPMIVGAIAPAPGAEGAAPLVVAPNPDADGAKLLDGGAQVRVTGMSSNAYTIYISSTCHSGETSAGLFDIEVLSPSGTWNDSLAYCADLCHTVIYNTAMNSCGDTSSQIAYILANYYPATTAPSAATTNARKAAAVQAAIWYFSNGATLTSATHDQIETATAAIIADANAHSGSVTVVPDSLTLTPASETNNTNFETTHTVTATLMGSNGLPMSGQTIHFRTTSGSNNPSLSYDGTTNASGQCSWTYTNTGGAGNDSIQAYTNNFTTPRGLQFCYPERQMIVLSGTPQTFRAETTASKKWVSCPDYDVTLLSYTVNCATNKTEFIYKVQGNGGSGTSLSHWSLELCSGLPTNISGYQVYKSSSCTNPVWTLMTGSTREYKAAGSTNNDMTDACGLSVPSLKINEGVDKNGCEAFKIVINGLWGTTAVHWAGKGGSDGAGGTCQYCEGGVTGPSCTPYTVPCSLDGPSSGCAGQSLTYTYTGGATGVTFKWYVDNVEQAGQTASSFNWTATAGSHTIKLRVTDANGCYNECSLPVTGNPPPACGISGPSAGCVSEPLTFNYSGGSTGVTFQWFVNNVVQASTGSSLSWTPSAPGSYTIKLIVTAANGCSSECTVTTTIAAPPTVIATGAEVCVASPAQLTASANDCAAMTYIWYKGGVQVGTGAALSFASTTLANAGVYTVVGTCTATGCSASATATLTVHPYPDVTLSNQTTCLGEPTTLASSMVALGDCTADGIVYTWSQWNGSAWVVIAGEDEASLSFTPSAVGTFRYKVRAACGECADEAEATVTVVSRDIVVHKYYDLDQDGEYDAEEMLSGWTFTLYDAAGNSLGSKTTDASGTVTFSGLAVGEYTVVETVQPLWASSTGAEQEITLTCAGGTAHVWFGNYELCNLTATLSGGGSCLCLSNPPTLLVDTTGSICAGTLHYEWFLDGVKITTAPDAPSYQPTADGSYTVKVSCVADSGPLCDVTTNAQSVSFDRTDPTWDQTMPGDLEGVECNAVPDAPEGFTASDNCDPSVDVDFDEDITPGSCPDSYTLTRTWTATDNCGNSISWTQTIEVVDTTDPTLSSKPADVTVECNAVPNVPAITASDNCDEYVPVQFSETRQSGTCDDSYTLVRTWTATDDCGNSVSHTQTITVQDTTKPSWVVSSLPDPDTVYAECDAVPDFPPDPIATDNCSTPVVTRSEERIYQQGACASNYTLVVTWTATDDCLNEITFSYYIVVRDTTDPIISCPPLETVQCRADVSAPDITKVTASDNCGAVVVTWQGDVSDGHSCPETITRTYRATDECGNWAECTQTIVVDDTINPTITCPPPVTVQCLADVPVPNTASVSATDNCGAPTVTWQGDVSDGHSCPETITRTYRATDDCGNYVECTQTIVVDDTIDPYWVSVLPQDRTVECNAIPPKPSVLDAGDNCDANVSVTLDEDVEDGECEDSYIIIYTWTATDDCGNSISHTQRITVQDTTDPVLSEEPEDVTVECNAVPGAPTITATDNCDGDVTVDFSETRLNGDCLYNYTLVRRWWAVDDCGNMIEHTQVVTVQDTTDPTWLQDMPEDVTVECNSVPVAPVITATDSCGKVTVDYDEVRTDGDCADSYTLTRTWTATDECGNSIEYTQVITVQDTTNPEWEGELPGDVTVECNMLPLPAVLTATDNCDADVLVTYNQTRADGACPDGYTLMRMWVATDDCGNAITHTQTITVEDTTPPEWVEELPPTEITLECDETIPPLNLTATDNCGEVSYSMVSGIVVGPCPQTYVIERGIKATDDCGNSITFSQRVIVQDTTDPVWDQEMPEDETVECDAVPVAPVITATDNCGNVTVTYDETRTDGDCESGYTLTRVWTATDECGNGIEYTQVITVQDTTDPEWDTESLPEDETVECDKVPEPGNPTATDNCDELVEVSYGGETRTDGLCADSYTLTRTWVATDDCGNSITHVQVITVQDTTNPEWEGELPEDETVECNGVPQPPTLTATDNCDEDVDVDYDEVRADGDCANSYTLTRTWTATDECGNSIEYTQVITVQDTTNPEWEGELPGDVTVECNMLPLPAVLTATDNCDADVLVTYGQTRADGACPDGYTLMRMWVATDDCGNTITHTQTITVQDTTDPEWEGRLPEDETVECNAVPNPPTLTATDNCDEDVDVDYTETRTDGNCEDSYILTRVWTATDDCGNSITHTQIITVEDNQNPTWDQEMPTDETVECDQVPEAPEITASDTCDGEVDIAFNETSVEGTCPDNYILTRIWVAVDDCGNTLRWTQIITVQDTTPPTWSQNMPGDVTVECDEVPLPPADITGTDNCGDVVVTYIEERSDGDCANSYTLTRTWMAEDECGNQTTHVQVITVVDMTPPEITCAEDVLVCADQNLEAVIGDYTAQIIASDNCSLPENLVVTQSPAAGTVVTVPVGQGSIIVPITFTVADECGNESECEISFEVRTGNVIVNKYEDLDADGAKDLGEQPLAGWTMTLVDAEGNVVASGVTDGNGQVFFDNLGCGVYTVTETLQDGWVNVTPLEQAVTVVMDETAEVTFGNFHCMTVFGYKWKDYDGDGVWDTDEPAIYNWTIELSDGQKTTTDISGRYAFTVCVPGDYTVSEAMPDGWEASTPTEADFRASSGQNIGPINFGNRQLFGGGGVMGSKFWDENGNGVWDAGEATIAGIKIIIRDSKGDEVFQTTTINAPGAPAHGAWKCEQGLGPGIYTVEEVVPDGWVATYPAVNGNVYKIEILDDGTFKLISEEPSWYTNLSFGNGRLMGYKWYDLNENGQYDTGEEKLANWRILVKDMNYNTVVDTKTNSAGYWFMPKLAEGDYYVVEEPQEGWTQVYPTDFNGAFKIHLYTDGSYDLLSPAQPWFEGLNFGNVRTGGVPGECPLCPEWVVFQSNRSDEDPMNTEIYKMRFDGTDVRRLTNEPGEDVQPTWSFDGTRIAFTSMRDGDWEIYRMGAQGGTGVNVTKFPNAADMNPSWACYWIAFQTNRDGNWEIYKTDPEGIQQIRLTDNPADDTAPAWSPDGQWVAYQSNRDGNWNIYIMGSDGSKDRPIVENPASDLNPTWSPDGNWIAFQSDRDGQMDIYKVNVETLEVIRLTDDPALDSDPAWMPYCDYIFFQSQRDGDMEVYRMEEDGSEQTNISNEEDWLDALDFVTEGQIGQAVASITLANGLGAYDGTTDATIDAWAPTVNLGNEHSIKVRHAAVWNGLIRFDLSSVPANVNIISAALSFYVLDRTNASPLEVGLYKLNRNWSEDAATYNLAAAGVPWTVPGAGSDADPDPAAVTTFSGVNQTVTFDVTDLVKGWYASPGSNKGALLFGQQADSAVAYSLASSEHNNVIYRPSLQIIFEYQP